MNGSGDQLDHQRYCQLSDSLAVCLGNIEVSRDFFADDGGKGESRSHRDHVPDEEQAKRGHRKRPSRILSVFHSIFLILDEAGGGIGEEDHE